MTETNRSAATEADTRDRELVVTRVFDAPRERVFQAFTDPRHIGSWWGPSGFTVTTHEIDVRPGGVWRFMMHGPDGTDYPNTIAYNEVTPYEKLAYDHGDDERIHFTVIVTFADRDGRTELTMRSLFPTAAERDAVVPYAVPGAQQTFDRLGAYLAQL